MSLTDLKRKQTKAQGGKNKKSITVDEFIEDANAYAQGKSQTAVGLNNPSSNRNFKNATFTLTPDNIDQLAQLSAQTGLAKAKIIRELIKLASKAPNIIPRTDSDD